MVPPSNKGVDYNFRRKGRIKLNGQANQPILIDEKIFKNRIRNGFFIEAGAYDGEILSNTLFFELKQRWTGLLIEPNPDAFELLKKKVRQYTKVRLLVPTIAYSQWQPIGAKKCGCKSGQTGEFCSNFHTKNEEE